MAHETSRPEADKTTEAPLFNVDALDNEQIRVLYQALDAMAPVEEDMSLADETTRREREVGDALWEKLGVEVRDLASRDPERVKELVSHSAQGDKTDREFAAVTANSLIDHDYSFTRDTLVALYVDESEWSSESSRMWAGGAIARLMRDKLTADQIVDFNAQIGTYGRDKVTPAAPGDERT